MAVIAKGTIADRGGGDRWSTKTRCLLVGILVLQMIMLFTSNIFEIRCDGVDDSSSEDGIERFINERSSTAGTTIRFSNADLPGADNNPQTTKKPPPKAPIHYSDEELLGVIPRVFSYPHAFPCHAPEQNWWRTDIQRSPARVGILYMKEMKTGSSTMAGVTLRMAKNMALRTTEYRICKSRFDHSMAFELQYGRRSKKESFLWTVLRNPTRRATSQFFHFKVSREKEEPSDVNFKEYMKHPVFQQYYLKSLAMTPLRKIDDRIEVANEIMRQYDFIGITERMDESLVVMSMMLNVPLEDVLYLNAKGNGGFDDGRYNDSCVYIVPPYTSPGMKEYFASEKWQESTLGDAQLYKAAWNSLDMTIDSLGRDEFQEKLVIFKEMRQTAEEFCADKVKYPCNADGSRMAVAPGCLWNDSGCGNQCLDEVAAMFVDGKRIEKSE